jgi:hypothetical protein
MTLPGRLALGIALVLAACQPATYVAYDTWDYDFRYAIYDDHWDTSGDINRPDRPQPPSNLGPRPTPPIYTPPSRPSVQPLPSSRPSAGRVGGAGSLRGSRR